MGGIVGLGGGIGAARLWRRWPSRSRRPRAADPGAEHSERPAAARAADLPRRRHRALRAVGPPGCRPGSGLRDESFRCLAALPASAGGLVPPGDPDLATHLYRTRLLRDRTASPRLPRLANHPASRPGASDDDDDVTTVVVGIDGGSCAFEDLVREQAAPAVAGPLRGNQPGEPAPGVSGRRSLRSPRAQPANPWPACCPSSVCPVYRNAAAAPGPGRRHLADHGQHSQHSPERSCAVTAGRAAASSACPPRRLVALWTGTSAPGSSTTRHRDEAARIADYA